MEENLNAYLCEKKDKCKKMNFGTEISRTSFVQIVKKQGALKKHFFFEQYIHLKLSYDRKA